MSVAAPSGLMRLTEVRARCAAALAPTTDDDPDVLTDVVDSLSPPVLMLIWADPWLSRRTVGQAMASGYWDAWLEVLCISARVVPGEGFSELEELVSYVIHRLQDHDDTWPPETFYAPRRFDIGGITYLGARLIFRVPVTV